MRTGVGSDMSFHPASNGLIPLREKTVPASPADVFFAGVERADMRYEQFEIEIDTTGGGVVYIRQDGLNGEDAETVVLAIHQVPAFIAALKAEIAKAEKGER